MVHEFANRGRVVPVARHRLFNDAQQSLLLHLNRSVPRARWRSHGHHSDLLFGIGNCLAAADRLAHGSVRRVCRSLRCAGGFGHNRSSGHAATGASGRRKNADLNCRLGDDHGFLAFNEDERPWPVPNSPLPNEALRLVPDKHQLAEKGRKGPGSIDRWRLPTMFGVAHLFPVLLSGFANLNLAPFL